MFQSYKEDFRCEFGFTRNKSSRKGKYVDKYKRQFLKFQNLWNIIDELTQA